MAREPKSSLFRDRVNGDLPFVTCRWNLGGVALTTSYAGLELFARYLRGTRFNTGVREVFAGVAAWGDYGAGVTVRLLKSD